MYFLKNFVSKLKLYLNIINGRELFIPIQIHCPKIRLGSEYGGWYISDQNISENSIVYSLGIGEDISFDLELIRRFKCQVFAYDPTPKSIAWLGKQQLPGKFHYFAQGVADYDGTANFFPPDNPEHISHTLITKNAKQDKSFQVDVRRLETIFKATGHSEIDILKMDIEGAEYGVLDDLLEYTDVNIRQILIEFHHRFPEIGIDKTRQAIYKLNQRGYKIFAKSNTGEEYSFIKDII